MIAERIFTNCREREAMEALELLGVADLFQGILGTDFMGEFCKPEKVCNTSIIHGMAISGRVNNKRRWSLSNYWRI